MQQTHPLNKYFQAFVIRELSAANSDDQATRGLSAGSQPPTYLTLDILVDCATAAADDLAHLQKTCEQKKQKCLKATM